MSWRDDLPEIPTEQMRRDVVREGGMRRAAARRRRTNVLTGAGLATVVLVIGGLVALNRPDDEGDSASLATAAAATTGAAASQTTARPAATAAEATGTTAMETEATTGPTGTEAAEATSPAGAEPTLPFVADVRVEPTTVWEQPAQGPACGPVAFEVSAHVPGAQRAVAIVHAPDGTFVEREMVLVGERATAVIDGFPPATVAPGSRATLLVDVTAVDPGGVAHTTRGPAVELVDCGS